MTVRWLSPRCLAISSAVAVDCFVNNSSKRRSRGPICRSWAMQGRFHLVRAAFSA